MSEISTFTIFFSFCSELGEAFKILGEDPDCRVIVFTGNGKAFCAGIDLNDLMALGNIANDDEKDVARKSFEIFKVIKKFQNSFFEIEKVQFYDKLPTLNFISAVCLQF